jgi:hypothetical protein
MEKHGAHVPGTSVAGSTTPWLVEPWTLSAFKMPTGPNLPRPHRPAAKREHAANSYF